MLSLSLLHHIDRCNPILRNILHPFPMTSTVDWVEELHTGDCLWYVWFFGLICKRWKSGMIENYGRLKKCECIKDFFFFFFGLVEREKVTG